MLTAREVALILAISESAVRKISASDLPPYRLGPRRGAVRYMAEDVDAYLRACRWSDPDQEQDEPLRYLVRR